MKKEGRNMQMYAVVATGVLGLLIGFWLGRSIRWNMEETEEEAVNRQEERRITGNRLKCALMPITLRIGKP